jgi:hypothetical protein
MTAPVPPGTLTPPAQVYSFTDHSTSLPSTPQPGDKMDAQTVETTRSIQAIINCLTAILRGDGYIANTSIGFPQLTPDVVAAINQTEPVTLPPDIQQAVNDANAARDAAQGYAGNAKTSETNAGNSSSTASTQAANASTSATNAASTVSQAGTIAAGFPAAQTALTNATASAKDAVANAQAAEQLAWKWGELLSGPVLTEAEYAAIDPALKPPGYQYNPVGGVAGLWSAHWWAVKASEDSDSATSSASDAQAAADAAAQSLDDFQDLYLGNKAGDPTVDNQGDPLQQGALYYNTTTSQMRVWSGSAWQNLAGGAGIADAPQDSHTYGRKNATWVDVAVASGAIPEAPLDGAQYARQSAGWTQVIIPTTIDWANVTNTPATYPPSPHTHAESDVINLVSDLALKAPLASPAFTGTPTSATTPAPGDSSGKLATTAFVTALAAAYAPLDSPVFVNTPTAPTPTPGDNSLKLATTQFVTTAIGTASNTTISLSTAPPATPKVRDWWWQSDTGRLFIYYQDVDSSQWVGTQPGATDPILASLITLGPTLIASDIIIADGPNQADRLPAGTTGQLLAMDTSVPPKPHWTTTLTQTLAIAPATSTAQLVLNKPVATGGNNLLGQTAGVNRWTVQLGNGVAESGSNAGSDFALNRYNDAGAVIDAPFTISRATAAATFSSTLTVTGALTAGTFQSVSVNAILGNNGGSGAVYLRPNGVGSGTGQTYVASDGSMSVSGNITSTNQVTANGGAFMSKAAGAGNSQFTCLDSSGNARSNFFFQGSSGTTYVNSVTPGCSFSLTGNCQASPASGNNFLLTGGLGYQNGGGPWTALSDKRIKTEIAEFTDGLDAILALRPVEYVYNNNETWGDEQVTEPASIHERAAADGKHFIGLIAQEAELVIPAMVEKHKGTIDGEAVDDLRAMNTNALTYALINAVKELNAEIVALKAQLKGA